MGRGQSIRIFLADGSVTGIRHAEVVNWTGQAVACPRNRVAELKDWEEAQRPGVYLLFGTDEATGRAAVYIGEAEHVLVRMQEHLANKDFWNEIILFTNKDQNLTKAHVRYLESRLWEAAKSSKRYVVLNANTPSAALLPRGDRDAMEDFLDQARLLLGALGHRVLEPVASATPQPTIATPQTDPQSPARSTAGTRLRLATKSVQAEALLTNEGIVVLAQSQAAAKQADSLSGSYRTLRDELLQQGVLVNEGTALRFVQDQLFSSPSAAACVVTGYSINGRDAWKTPDGQSVGQLEQSLAAKVETSAPAS
jgi:hypothetical protein